MPQSRQPALRQFLDRLLSHSVLDDAEQAAILDLRVAASHAARNRDFVRYGETVGHSCLVGDGLVGAFGQSRDGTRQITSFYLPGDMADLHSVVTPRAAHALQALSPTTILRVRHDDLRDLAAAHPAIAEAFWRDCVVSSDTFAQWVVNVGSRMAVTRMAHVFCELGLRYERARLSAKDHFPMLMTQTHLGEALGLTPVHVNRTLKVLRGDGVLSFKNSAIMVHDWDKLAEIGEFDAVYLRLDDEPIRFGWFGAAANGQALH